MRRHFERLAGPPGFFRGERSLDPHPRVPIIGATRLSHLNEAIASLDLKLTSDEIEALEAPYRPHWILGHDHPKPSRMVK